MTFTAACALAWCVSLCFIFVTHAALMGYDEIQRLILRSRARHPVANAINILARVIAFAAIIALCAKAFGA